VGNLARSIKFYGETLGLEFIAQYDPPGLAFFRLGRTRLLLRQSSNAKANNAVLYFEVPDIEAAYATLMERGFQFDSQPHLIYRDE
jgi:catechol 2,3-dioxygenase-like lactoylglutathione lyase family enzyme